MFSPEELADLRSLFVEEARSHLGAIDLSIAALRLRSVDAEAMADLLRDVHTLKGAAGSVLLDEWTRHLHVIEERVVALRAGVPTPADWEAIAAGIGLLRQRLADLRPLASDTGAPSGPAMGRLFARLTAALRALERQSGKALEVLTAGDDVDLSATLADRLYEPLLHLARNAVAHGIDPFERRMAAGKPPVGRIDLIAERQADTVVFKVIDDGAGIDHEDVRRALVRSGFLTEQAAQLLPAEALVEAIFESGLSTRGAVDDLAGRGIGLDAVRQALAELGGSISCSSEAGRGTCFTITLPVDQYTPHRLGSRSSSKARSA